MDRKEFLEKFAELFEETNPDEIKYDTKFHDLEDWSSLVGMMAIALAKLSYHKIITGEELRKCITVEDVYNLINSK